MYFPSFFLLLACLRLVSFRLSTTLFLKHDCKHKCTCIHLKRSLSCTNQKKYNDACMCVFVRPCVAGCRVSRKSDMSLRNFKELSFQSRPSGTQRRGTGMYTHGTTLFCKICRVEPAHPYLYSRLKIAPKSEQYAKLPRWAPLRRRKTPNSHEIWVEPDSTPNNWGKTRFVAGFSCMGSG